MKTTRQNIGAAGIGRAWRSVRGPASSALVLATMAAAGCGKVQPPFEMMDQPKYQTYQPSEQFADEASARPLPEGVVPRGQANLDEVLYHGKQNGQDATTFPPHWPTEKDGPFPTKGDALKVVLARGHQKFDTFCAMCHGQAGDGEGIIVTRGMVRPPSYHIDRLRQAPVGHFFDVISNGYGAMYSYNERVSPADRWAIIAYIRTLQMSQASREADLPPADREALRNPQPAEGGEGGNVSRPVKSTFGVTVQ